MDISTEINGEMLSVTLKGRLDTLTTPQLDAAVQPHLAQCTSCLLNVQGLDYVSSAGLRIILMLHKRMTAAGGRLVLKGIQDGVQDILNMTGFSSFLLVE